MLKDKFTACQHPIAQALLQLMQEKQSNLCFSADMPDKSKFLSMVDLIGPEICLLKTHIDIIEAVDDTFIRDLQHLSEKHKFLIFEDRKFADIGNTVKHQYQGGHYHIVEWAHIVNAHPLPGPGIVSGLKAVGMPKGRALLLLAQMSSRGNLIDDHYVCETLKMANDHKDFVIGFISQTNITDNPHFLLMSPGIQLEIGGDKLGQQYKTPEQAIENGTDIIIVGRGIFEADDPLATAKLYKKRAWKAYV